MVGAALTKSGGHGLAAFAYISCGMLAVCVDGMLGLLCYANTLVRGELMPSKGSDVGLLHAWNHALEWGHP